MTTFWLNNPTILFNKDSITEVWPLSNMSSVEKLNAITRLVLLLTILGFLISKTFKVVITGLITLAAIILLNYLQNNTTNTINIKEAYTNQKLYTNDNDKFKEPTEKNPTMNILPTQNIQDSDSKPAAPSYLPEIEEKINENTKKIILNNFNNDPDIEKKLFKDLGDNYNFEHSMRNWYTTANTQNPNDQNGFANFCYDNMTSCKEGDALACSKNTPSRVIDGD